MMPKAKKTEAGIPDTETTAILPDFCDNQVLLLVVLTAELLAIVLTLSYGDTGMGLFTHLGYSSLFIQSVALIDAALLCVLQKKMHRLDPRLMAALIYIALQLVTLVVSEISIQIIKMTTLHLLFSDDWYKSALIRNISISAIITAVLMRYFYIRHQWQQQIEAENRTHIQALQARIRPHFLFNSLNTIASLIHAHPGKAEDAVLDLADMFRTTLADLNVITLAEEMDITQRYLRMEKLRLGERLIINWQIDDASKITHLPALTLQPLVENAIYHGIEPLAEGGTIIIRATLVNLNLVLSVTNPKVPDNDKRGPIKEGNRIALNNIRQRLGLSYQGKASLSIEDSAREFVVTVQIPLTRPEHL